MNWKYVAVLIFVAGCSSAPAKPDAGAPPAPIVVQQSEIEPVAQGTAVGRADALVTVVAFGDPAAPQWEELLTRLRATTLFAEGEVRIALKAAGDISPAGREALVAMHAAGAQGKFWAMHDELLDWRAAWPDGGAVPLAVARAESIGVDLESFRAALGPARAEIEAQERRASAEGFPAGTLSLNGRLYLDDADAAKLEAALTAVAEDARSLLARGTQRDALYATAVLANQGAIPFGPRMLDSPRVPVAGSPMFGNPEATVTVVAFMDLECPFSDRAYTTLYELVENDADVRVVFKHLPLEFHKTARQAASFAAAAHAQGKFWEMADQLFQKQKTARQDNLDEYAAEKANALGLDVARLFEDAKQAGAAVDRDLDLARELGVSATPTFFVNGEVFRGAQPLGAFQAIVDRRRADAQALGAKPREVYMAAVQQAFENPSPAVAPKPPVGVDKPQAVPVSADDPALGATKDFLVTVVVFSDFQCPFCQRLAPTLDALVDAYPKTVRVVFKHLPLAFHKSAADAARAAIAAGKQGKFWEMHDLLFAERLPAPQEMDAYTEKLAKQLGLKLKQFKADRAAAQPKVDADMKLAEQIGARGTPTSFINGVRLGGAQPLASFQDAVDAELAFAKQVAEETGLGGQALYDEVLKRRAEE